ncbi:MAG: NADH-quinone oxidoreductase subunit A [Dehalococcoidia bacterium]
MSFYDGWSAVMMAVIGGFILVGTALLASRVLAPFGKERGKAVSYECGMLPIGRNWAQIHVRYYLIAILFLLFDVEAVFLFPWVVQLRVFPEWVLYEVMAFVLVLGLGLGYAWKKGVLEWR